MFKPIIRWTIGPSSKLGIKCLFKSVEKIFNIYKNKFDYYVCYNQICLDKIIGLKKFNINFIKQEDYINSLKIPPIKENPCWKLYPPRINKNTHEIFIDNDLIIYKKMPILDLFLEQKDLFIITEGFKKNYGAYEHLIKKNLKISSGFFGIPPNYDFEKDLNERIFDWNLKEETKHFNEQGLVALCFLNKKIKIISISEINVAFKEREKIRGFFGTHFVGVNQIKTIFME